MRNLTIQREKTFVACLMTMKIYIEDNANGNVMIDGVYCHKIGELKNGESKTFEIASESAKVFVIADQLSRNYCNEYYQLPEGEEDITLSGKNSFNLTTGNAFCFHNNNNPEVHKNRKKNSRRGTLILVLALLLGIAIGLLSNIDVFFEKEAKSKLFTVSPMTIQLTDKFEETNEDGFFAVFESKEAVVIVTVEEFASAPVLAEFTCEEYGAAFIQVNEIDTVLQTEDCLTFFKYKVKMESGNNYHYTGYIYKTDDAFYVLRFATYVSKAETYAPLIKEWASSVKFE